jgi:hypothetical protein
MLEGRWQNGSKWFHWWPVSQHWALSGIACNCKCSGWACSARHLHAAASRGVVHVVVGRMLALVCVWGAEVRGRGML